MKMGRWHLRHTEKTEQEHNNFFSPKEETTTRDKISMKVKKILRDERINVFGMTYGFPESSRIPPQIFLCKKKAHEKFMDGKPFILYPKATSPTFQKSRLGNAYSDTIKNQKYKPEYIAYVDSIYFINVNQAIFTELHNKNFFSIWLPSEPFTYYNNNKTGYIVILRVFLLSQCIDKLLIENSTGIRGRHVISELDNEIEVSISKPIINDMSFNEYKRRILHILDENRGAPQSLFTSTTTASCNYNNPVSLNSIDDIRNFELNNSKTPETQREAIIQSRIGQGKFRTDLLRYWKCCAVTACQTTDILKASHIKPWRDSDNSERLDPYNGLLLTPNLDSVFDNGFISFNDNGSIIISDLLSKEDAKKLDIHPELKISKLTENHCNYLSYHRKLVFRGPKF